MKTIVTSALTRNLLSEEEILRSLREVVPAADKERERIIGGFLDCCVLRSSEESVLARDAMRFFFWYTLEQHILGRISEERFVANTYPVFVRFCEGAPRESTAEDVKRARLMNAALYTRERDPLARALRVP